MMLFASYAAYAQTPIYSLDFESDLTDATIVGSGEIVSDDTEGFGKVFHNVGSDGTQALRTNYLLLPSDIFANVSNAATNQVTIGFWVNVGTATEYFYTPIFSAYGAAPADNYSSNGVVDNTWPMFILQSRLIAQVNCAGWCNFDDVLNDTGSNTISTSWLDDGAWHYYTAVYTTSSLQIYVDGTLQNAWTVDNTTEGSETVPGEIVGGLFTGGADLDYICLGGNQAWEWADPDPAYKFDDFVVYSEALTQAQINTIISDKTTSGTTTAIEDVTADKGNVLSTEYYSISGANVGSVFNQLKPGIYIKKCTYENGSVETTKICKDRY